MYLCLFIPSETFITTKQGTFWYNHGTTLRIKLTSGYDTKPFAKVWFFQSCSNAVIVSLEFAKAVRGTGIKLPVKTLREYDFAFAFENNFFVSSSLYPW